MTQQILKYLQYSHREGFYDNYLNGTDFNVKGYQNDETIGCGSVLRIISQLFLINSEANEDLDSSDRYSPSFEICLNNHDLNMRESGFYHPGIEVRTSKNYLSNFIQELVKMLGQSSEDDNILLARAPLIPE